MCGSSTCAPPCPTPTSASSARSSASARRRPARSRRWNARGKPSSVVRSTGSTGVSLIANFADLQQWTRIRKGLETSRLVQDLNVESISVAGADITFNYAGSPEQLQSDLRVARRRADQRQWRLGASGVGSAMTGGGRHAGQLFLDFPKADPDSRPLIETGSYADAVTAIRRWRLWPGGQMALVGEAQSGRTRLSAHVGGRRRRSLRHGRGAGRRRDRRDRATVRVRPGGRRRRPSRRCDGPALRPSTSAGTAARRFFCPGVPSPPAGSRPRRTCARAWPPCRSPISTPPDDETLAARLREEFALRHLIIPRRIRDLPRQPDGTFLGGRGPRCRPDRPHAGQGRRAAVRPRRASGAGHGSGLNCRSGK